MYQYAIFLPIRHFNTKYADFIPLRHFYTNNAIFIPKRDFFFTKNAIFFSKMPKGQYATFTTQIAIILCIHKISVLKLDHGWGGEAWFHNGSEYQTMLLGSFPDLTI